MPLNRSFLNFRFSNPLLSGLQRSRPDLLKPADQLNPSLQFHLQIDPMRVILNGLQRNEQDISNFPVTFSLAYQVDHFLFTFGYACLYQQFLPKEYRVAIFEKDSEAGEEAVHDLAAGNKLLFLPVDISREDEVRDAIGRTISKFNKIDVLINNAAISANKPIAELSLVEWQQVIDVNLTGTFLCSRLAMGYLKKSRGSIINICSTRAFMSEPDTEAYSASKGGVFALSHAMALSLAPDVRVNAISPGWIDVTRLQKKNRRNPYQFREEDHRQHPAGRVGRAEDVAALALFLADEKAGFITGENIMIDGGMTRKMIYV